METHFPMSLVQMAVLSPVFQHVPNHFFSFVAVVRDATIGTGLAGTVITWETGTGRHLGSFFGGLHFFMTGFAPLTSRERHEPWTAFVRAAFTVVVTSDGHNFNIS